MLMGQYGDAYVRPRARKHSQRLRSALLLSAPELLARVGYVSVMHRIPRGGEPDNIMGGSY